MDPISVNDVVAGDILLYHGDALVSKLIRFFDGTEVNHAAICIGKGEIGEAQAKGLSRSTIDAGLKSPQYIIVRRLKSIPDTMQPVVDKAKYYLNIGNRYAFEQILLLAFLGISRKLQINLYLKWLLRKLLDQAADWLTANGDRQPMICSEYVYRCYNEALPAEHDPYAINIEPLPVVITGTTRHGRAETRPAPHNGIHRDSLLAWVDEITSSRDRTASSSLLRSIREVYTHRTIRPLSADEKRISSMSLDDLIDHYLKEIRNPITRSLIQDALLRSPEILASIEKFGRALYSAANKTTAASSKQRLTRSTEDQIADHLSHLLKTVEDFVTPGDLLKCIDLSNIGEIMPKA